MSETRNDAVQTVRKRKFAQVHEGRLEAYYVITESELASLEAVVNAARDVRYDVMNEGFLSQETSDQVHAALEALDSQEERTP